MPNYALLKLTAQELLSTSSNAGSLVYEEDVATLAADGTISQIHHQISGAQAKAIMNAIIADGSIIAALRAGIQKAVQDPQGNLPIDGAHSVDPVVDLIKMRAIIPILRAPPPSNITLHFVGLAYDYIEANR